MKNIDENLEKSIDKLIQGVNDSESLINIQTYFSEKVYEKLECLGSNYPTHTFNSIDSCLVQAMQRIEDMRQQKEDITGVPSGFPSLDKLTYGWQNSDLIVLAARPSVGKTTFAINLALNAALHLTKPTPVALFSLEMSADKVVNRILSAESEIWLEKIAQGKMEEHEMKQLYVKGIQRLEQAPIVIDDTAALNIFELRAKCRQLKTANNIGLIIIDYLQLMRGIRNDFNREQDISRITRELKGLAKELQIPIIALSQLSREVEKRSDGNKMPQLSDLRDSGAIEQDADMVCFIYRPEYYDIYNNEMGETNRGETHIRIAKHRNGSLQTIVLRARLEIQRFYDDLGGGDFGGSNISSNFKPVTDTEGPRMYIQTGGKMDNLLDDDDPF